MRIVAVASGTSADALDIGVVDVGLEGSSVTMGIVATGQEPWPEDLRRGLLDLLPPAATTAGAICQLDQLIGVAVAEAVGRVVSQLDRPPHLVVSPGQTVFRDVRDGRCYGTLQLGQPAWVAERTGLPVVSDLRARDVAAGGHGAPLASTLDGLWLAGPGGPRVALNLGGIANVSVVGDEGQAVKGWDTGPGQLPARRRGPPGHRRPAEPRRRRAPGPAGHRPGRPPDRCSSSTRTSASCRPSRPAARPSRPATSTTSSPACPRSRGPTCSRRSRS